MCDAAIQPAGDLAIRRAKRELRRAMQDRIRTVAPGERARESRAICERVLESREWTRASSVLLFAPMPDEADIGPLLEAAWVSGRTLVLPRYEPGTDAYWPVRVWDLEAELRVGAFGIREPLPSCPIFPPNQLDLTLLPGLAFDLDGWRLGRGKGYYDRLAAGLKGVLCGVAMDWQVVASVPAEAHDKRVNLIVTPTRWLEAGRAQEP